MRTDLPPLIHDEAKAKLEIDLGNLEYGLVVVESIEVHSARQLELVLKVVEQVESQVLYWSRFSTRVSILLILPSELDDRLFKGDAPVDLPFLVWKSVIFAEEAVIFTSIRFNDWRS